MATIRTEVLVNLYLDDRKIKSYSNMRYPVDTDKTSLDRIQFGLMDDMEKIVQLLKQEIIQDNIVRKDKKHA